MKKTEKKENVIIRTYRRQVVARIRASLPFSVAENIEKIAWVRHCRPTEIIITACLQYCSKRLEK